MVTFPTLELGWYRKRVTFMAAAAALALTIDFATKTIAVALEPRTLLFNISMGGPFGRQETLILVVAAASLLACVLPERVVAIGAGVALGGALGNLSSRYLWGADGGSPDFIPFADGSTGNFADLFITLGGIAMLLGAALWLVRTTFRNRTSPGSPE